ncbi:molybdopterin synthase [Halobium salinum]|uniref:Molybdopterin synthase n=1 Tax=Halobium salinum TaxID=1364940 RepID=A0ABD5PG10_9EURY|nr:molybdopterin synthase [Halobium salinum]
MQTLGLVGPDAAALAERLVPRLDGRVATVEPLPDRGEDASRPAAPGLAPGSAAAGAFGVGPDGSWVGAGEDRSLADTLDTLAPEYDYALLVGFPEADVPAVVVGGDEGDDSPTGEVLGRVPDAGGADLGDLTERLDATEPHVTLESLVRRVKASPRAERAGAIATFTGRVRAKDDDGDPRTTALAFETYEGVADDRMETIRTELTDRAGVEEVLLHHRTGVVPDGEDIVFVVVLAGHRGEAFRAVEDGINRLKDEVPIFKKETTVEDEFWVHDRDG